jgi:hypothetical protein
MYFLPYPPLSINRAARLSGCRTAKKEDRPRLYGKEGLSLFIRGVSQTRHPERQRGQISDTAPGKGTQTCKA